MAAAGTKKVYTGNVVKAAAGAAAAVGAGVGAAIMALRQENNDLRDKMRDLPDEKKKSFQNKIQINLDKISNLEKKRER
jgi:hypothetical protein